MGDKRTRFMIQTISYRIDRMLNDKSSKTFFTYSGDNIADIVIGLQRIYEGRAVVSRTPAGIVAHISPAGKFDEHQDVSDEMLSWSMPPIRVIAFPASPKATRSNNSS